MFVVFQLEGPGEKQRRGRKKGVWGGGGGDKFPD